MNERPELHLGMTPGFVMPGLFTLLASNSYWLGMTMFRLQEFYESKYDDIRGKVFSFEMAMDRYAKPDGKFDYAKQWAGFNVPGHVIDEFFVKFRGMLTQKEYFLRSLLDHYRPLDPGERYYLIGVTHDTHPGIMGHERCHAAFYIDETYRKTMTDLVKRIPARQYTRMCKALLEEGYSSTVHVDEIQAYLCTNTKTDNRTIFKEQPALAGRFRAAYKAYFSKPREA